MIEQKNKFTEIFNLIYSNQGWHYGSGPGSFYERNIPYIKLLKKIIKKYKIKSVVDFGCGDWQFSQYIDWENIDYLGYDVVNMVIENNSKQFKKENVNFAYTPDDWAQVKSADLLICKDVIQHFNNESINEFIKTILPKFKYAIITNCRIPDATVNQDIPLGGYRALDLRLPPFCVPMKKIYTYPLYAPKGFNPELKYTLFYEHGKTFDMRLDLFCDRFERIYPEIVNYFYWHPYKIYWHLYKKLIELICILIPNKKLRAKLKENL